MVEISDTMRTKVKGEIEITEDNQVFIIGDSERLSFTEVFGKFHGLEVDITLNLNEKRD